MSITDSMGRPLYYTLNDAGEPVPCSEQEGMKGFSNDELRRVGGEEFEDGTFVSTVFLRMDHNFMGEGDPVLWETMIFSDIEAINDYQERYTSKEAALKGHEKAVRLAKKNGAK